MAMTFCFKNTENLILIIIRLRVNCLNKNIYGKTSYTIKVKYDQQEITQYRKTLNRTHFEVLWTNLTRNFFFFFF